MLNKVGWFEIRNIYPTFHSYNKQWNSGQIHWMMPLTCHSHHQITNVFQIPVLMSKKNDKTCTLNCHILGIYKNWEVATEYLQWVWFFGVVYPRKQPWFLCAVYTTNIYNLSLNKEHIMAVSGDETKSHLPHVRVIQNFIYSGQSGRPILVAMETYMSVNCHWNQPVAMEINEKNENMLYFSHTDMFVPSP